MKVLIRASKHQEEEMTTGQLIFASKCVIDYKEKGNKTVFIYSGHTAEKSYECEVYRTKTQISAIVYFK